MVPRERRLVIFDEDQTRQLPELDLELVGGLDLETERRDGVQLENEQDEGEDAARRATRP